MNTVVDAMSKLRILEDMADRFCRDFEHLILTPCLTPRYDHSIAEFSVEGDSIQVSGYKTGTSVSAVIEDIHRIAEYLTTRLPPTLSTLLSRKLMPSLIPCLTSDWLVPSVPASLDGVRGFQDVLAQVMRLADYVGELGWVGQDQLVQWVESAPRVWLSKRKEAALAATRSSCYKGISDKKGVERVETQMVTRGDVIMSGDQAHNDWEAGWSDEEDKGVTATSNPQAADEEVDASAWGLEEDEPRGDNKTGNADANSPKAAGEDEVEAWGWGDDETDAQDVPTTALPPAGPSRPATNGDRKPAKSSGRELTLKETYTVTAVPDAILELIVHTISDAEALAQPPYVFGSLPISLSSR